jgi:hypothetical protein
MRKINVILILFGFIFLANIGFAQDFTDVTAQSGIQAGASQGFCWGDYNNDSLIDIYQSSINMLFINTGVDDAFSLVSTSPAAGTGIGSVMADFTGDGNLDLLTTQGGSLALIVNTGDTLSFIDTTSGVWLDSITVPNSICEPAVADFDRDGNLEIAFTGAYADVSQTSVRLAKLNVETGKYENVAGTVLDDTTHKFEAWNPTWVDIDNDGYLDLFVPSIRGSFPTCKSGLYLNYSGEGLDFSEIEINGSDTDVSAIASVLGDIDNDGDMDLITQAFGGDGGALYVLLNNGDATFTDTTAASGITPSDQMRGLCFGDYDNDGDLDLLIGGNGLELTIYQSQLVGGSLTFTNVTETTIGTEMTGHRSALFIDYNLDGFLDVFASYTGAVKLFKNNLTDNNWIGFRLSMTEGNNKSAIGARVRVVAGDLSMIRDVQGGGYGGMTGGNLVAHFGLGSAEQADSVIIKWPDGTSSELLNYAANQYYDVDETTTSGIEETQDLPKAFALKQISPNPFNEKTTISYAVANEGPVKIALYDLLGREIALLVNGVKQPGTHTVELNAANLSSGIYFCHMQAGEFDTSQKLLLTK